MFRGAVVGKDNHFAAGQTCDRVVILLRIRTLHIPDVQAIDEHCDSTVVVRIEWIRHEHRVQSDLRARLEDLRVTREEGPQIVSSIPLARHLKLTRGW